MTPEGAIRFYYGQKDTIGPPALNFIDSIGRVHAPKCIALKGGGECGSKLRNETAEGFFVCGYCGEPWSYVDAYIFKGHISTSRTTDVFERKNAAWMDIGVLLMRFIDDPAWQWEAKIYVASVMGWSIRDLSSQFTTFYPKAPGPWGKTMVHERLARARTQWICILRESGAELDLN